MPGALQCSSTAVSLTVPERGIHRQQACFASWSGEGWSFGDAAQAQFHTDALDHNVNTYFTDCLQTSVMHHGAWSGTPLDLVYEQLSVLLDGYNDDLLLLPSSVYSDEQLGAIGGVLQTLANVVAVVRMPLAYGVVLPPGRYAVVEMEMRDAAWTELEITADDAVIRPARIVHGVGLQHSCSEQFRLICERFIRRHRYDAAHAAGNKPLLLRQLREQWADDKEVVRLIVNDHEVHVDKEVLTVPLPQRLLEQLKGRDHYLVPSPVALTRDIFSRVDLLPPLRAEHVRALALGLAPASTAGANTVSVPHIVGTAGVPPSSDHPGRA